MSSVDCTNEARERYRLRQKKDPAYQPARVHTAKKLVGSKELVFGKWVEVTDEKSPGQSLGGQGRAGAT